jgi:hypothetical protein
MVDQKYRIDGNIVLSAGTRLRRVWTSPLWLNKPKPWHGYWLPGYHQSFKTNPDQANRIDLTG